MTNTDFVNVSCNGKILNADSMSESVQELRKLVLDDDKLKQFRSDDAYLLRFLHCADFNVPIAFKKMQDFCNLLLKHPDWFASTSPLDKKTQIDKNAKVILKERDRSGRRICISKFGGIDVSSTYPQEQTQIDDIWFESVLDEPETQATGLSCIIDMKGYSWRLFRWFTPTNISIVAAKIDVYPFKTFVFHVVNTSFLFNATIKLVWPFLSKKVKDMTKFHFDNWSALHQYVSPEVLPPEYGGTGPEIDYEKLNQWLFDQDSEIAKKLKYQRISSKK